MKFLVWSLAVMLLLAFMTSCKAGGKEPLPDQTAAASPSPAVDGDLSRYEGELRQTVAEVADAIIQNDVEKYYASFTSDYQGRCPLDNFKNMFAVSRVLVGDFSGATFTFEGVDFQADRAIVRAYIDVGGKKLSFSGEGNYPPYWVFVDGAWKMTDDNPAPCPPTFPTPVAPQ